MEPITKLMTVGLLRLDGSYLYFSDVREENVDQLRLNISVRVFPRLKFSSLAHRVEFAAQRHYIQVFGLVHTAFDDLSAELLWHLYTLFYPRRILAKAS